MSPQGFVMLSAFLATNFELLSMQFNIKSFCCDNISLLRNTSVLIPDPYIWNVLKPEWNEAFQFELNHSHFSIDPFLQNLGTWEISLRLGGVLCMYQNRSHHQRSPFFFASLVCPFFFGPLSISDKEHRNEREAFDALGLKIPEGFSNYRDILCQTQHT